MSLLDRIYTICRNIAFFLYNWLQEKDSFNSRTFYGEAFSLAFLHRMGLLDKNIKNKLIKLLESLDRLDPEFHWEFNNYALLDYYINSKDENIKEYIYPLKFKNTKCTNWTLLRSVVKIMAKDDIKIAIKEAKMKINKFQLKSGLILDAPGVKSFQYHCFSMAMIGEIYEHTQDIFFKNSFLKGVGFIRNFILLNGEALYIGRGQNQSFGYGALIYILSLAYKLTNDKTLLGDIERVVNFVSKFQRRDGSFPLMMNGIEKNIPKIIDLQNEEFVGWYPYNNYFDYLPFMGFFIAKAHKILKVLDISEIKYKKNKEYRDKSFIKVVKQKYEAVLSKPGGYWTNDMPIPYVVANGKNITPCYGGEQFQKSLYSMEGIPLPYFEKFQKSIRWLSISFFKKYTLWVISPLGIMKRKFIFEEDFIDIETKVFSFFTFKHIYLSLNEDRDIFSSSDNLNFSGYEYSASGKLKKLICDNRVSKVRIKIES